MCTLLAAFRQYPEWPLVIAANRDELLSRPASPPFLWPGRRFLAPRDELAGGSWLGLNRAGLFVAVTNRFGSPRDQGRESRGKLVLEALEHSSARELHAQLSRLAPARFNAFHLLYADAENAFVSWSDGERLSQQELRPGTHVITERSLGGDDRSRTEHIREELRNFPEGTPAPEAWMPLLRRHAEGDPQGSICVHAPAFGYGTRSSMVLHLSRPPAGSRLFWAEGPPCTVPFEEQGALLGELFSTGESRTGGPPRPTGHRG